MNNEISIFQDPRRPFKIKASIKTEIGSYIVDESRIGVGGNGAVYKCQNQATGKEYAIKFLLSNSEKGKLRFEREHDFLKQCNDHNHIISFVDSGCVTASWKKRDTKEVRNTEIHFCIMEYAEDGNLREYIAATKSINFEIYTAQLRGLAEALHYMHGKNILHRDIKPENILIIGERWVLSDFGLTAPAGRSVASDLTGDKEKVGPVFWMSPEAINKCLGVSDAHSEINKSSDVFQLASVFWFIVTGRHPSGIYENCDWNGKQSIYDVIHKAMQHDPKRRYGDGIEFFNAIVQAIEN